MATQYIDPSTVTIPVTAGVAVVVKVGEPGFREMLRTDLEDTFYNPGEFAETVTWHFAAGGSQQIVAIFDEEHMGLDIDTGTQAIVSEPQIHVPEHKLEKVPGKGDKVTIRNRNFKVKSLLPDGTGVMVVALLRE